MDKSHYHDNIEWRLLERKLDGEPLTAEEEAEFTGWIDSDESHRRYFERVSIKWNDGSRIKVDVDGMYERFLRETEAIDSLARRRRRNRIVLSLVSAAAAVILIVGAVAFITRGSHDVALPNESALAAADSIMPGTQRACLILADGSMVDLDRNTADGSRTISGGGVTVTDSEISVTGTNPEAAEKINTLIIPRGGEYCLRLDDGTRVWLNARTTLKFPAAFCRGVRRVELTGEAYFEVAKDKSRPFIVATDRGDVRVYGTQFNVRAYPEEPQASTTLVSGSVGVDVSGRTYMLTPGEQAVVSTADVTVRRVNTAEYCAWHTGRFVFENRQLKDILGQLSDWYDVDFEYTDPELGSLHFTGNLKRYESFEKILDFIGRTTDVTFEIDGKKVTVSRSK